MDDRAQFLCYTAAEIEQQRTWLQRRRLHQGEQVRVFWVLAKVESDELKFSDAWVWCLGPENVTLGIVS